MLYCVLYYFVLLLFCLLVLLRSVNNVNNVHNVNNKLNFINIWVQEYGNLGRRLFTCSIISSHDSATE